jgi:hypothetical protein
MTRDEYILALEARLDAAGLLEQAAEVYKVVFETIFPTVADRELEAWQEVDRQFPTAPKEFIPEIAEVEIVYPEEVESEEDEDEEDERKRKKDPAVNRMIPRGWAPLPSNAQRHVEVEWVHQNWYRCRVRDQEDKTWVLRMNRAATKAPSWGAVGLLEVAFANPQKFESDVYAKEMKNAVEEEQKEIHQERLALVDCRKIIQQMMEFQTS